MNNGLDMDTDITAQCGCIKAAEFTFVGRYINRMTRAEADHIRSQGLYIVSIYETVPTRYGYFTEAQGTYDAQRATECAHSLGQPLHTPIYFAVDYNASANDAAGNISNYFSAICKVFTGGVQSDFGYYVGGYGNGAVLGWLGDHNLIQYAYLAAATDWYGSEGFEPWNLKQSLGPAVCGINCDHVVSNGNGGGWIA